MQNQILTVNTIFEKSLLWYQADIRRSALFLLKTTQMTFLKEPFALNTSITGAVRLVPIFAGGCDFIWNNFRFLCSTNAVFLVPSNNIFHVVTIMTHSWLYHTIRRYTLNNSFLLNYYRLYHQIYRFLGFLVFHSGFLRFV